MPQHIIKSAYSPESNILTLDMCYYRLLPFGRASVALYSTGLNVIDEGLPGHQQTIRIYREDDSAGTGT